jgi:hypothetical protein
MSMRVVSICTGRSNFDQLVVSCKQASKHAHTHTHTHTHTQTHICIHASQIIRSCIDIGDALGAIQKNGEESASPEPK